MNEVSRREAVRLLAAGAVGAAAASAEGSAVAAVGTADAIRTPSQTPPHHGPAHGFDVARRIAGDHSSAAAPLPVRDATVLHCRSWDATVYLFIDGSTHGFVELTATGFAIAAACQAAGRTVAVKVWGHDPAWANGAGRFQGALLSIDRRDLEPQADGPPLG